MSIKESLLKSYIHDLSISQHLATKFEPENADWRPRENMRSTLELMQYITYIGQAMARHFVNPPVDHEAARNAYREASKASGVNVTFANFSEAIEQEKDEIRAAFATITDADLNRMTYHPFSGDETTLFEALLTVSKYLAAYRQQLFLYAKMLGANVNTRNNWYGVDSTPAHNVPKPATAVA
jgi:hypothetical protein